MLCPREQFEMEYQGFFKYPRHACPSCEGLFVVERDVTENLGYPGPRKFEAIAEVKLDNLADSKLRCPKDNATMKVVRYEGAEIDICPSCCGLWLDKGEFQKIMKRAQQRVDASRRNPAQPEAKAGAASGFTTGAGVLDVEDVLDVIEASVRAVWRAATR